MDGFSIFTDVMSRPGIGMNYKEILKDLIKKSKTTLLPHYR